MGLAGAVRPFPALAPLVWQSPSLSRSDLGAGSMLGGWTPPSVASTKPLVRGPTSPKRVGGSSRPTTWCKSPGRCPFRARWSAGGNRTPVHQPVNELATTIPDVDTDAVSPTGRLSARGGPRAVFPTSQRSFSPSAVFPAVIPHFCCRAVMDWPRATFLLTMTLRSLDVNQAARANCSSAILLVAPFSESEQLGSQTRTALLTSKPVSPMFDM